ncbi:uncharacterized protein (DUF58 family) [Melghirimyces profundicolus]|uniref:Uncharacterized protein (DUF58 family) n=1 Tax=Melghirimyces profundicolus TaxID=1242148 RepID=A0A2T6BGA5_9BACL|nr:DUF58 domain-containing protein [Melghirimyces profundicolus]PTX55071.1 uncharacterized protein (DUF58 family) [Melghirimyces profundicolus]
MNSSKRSPVRYRFRDNALIPTPRLLLSVALGAVVTLAASPAGLEGQAAGIFYGALATLLAGEGFTLLRYGRLDLSRESAAFFELGEDNEVTLRVSHPAPYAVRCVLRDDFPKGFQVDVRDLILHLAPGEKGVARYRARPHRRGRHTFDRIHARVTGRFGLLMRQQAREAGEEKRVYPRLKEVRKVRGGIYRKQLLSEGPHTRRGLGRGSEFSHIRDYVPGDEPRMINWNATARMNKLATNVYQPEQGQHVAVLIDCGRVMGVKDGELSRLDRAVEAALAFAAIALERGDQVSLLAFSSRVLRWVPPGKGGVQLQRLVEAVHDLEPEYVESGYRTVVETLAFRQKRRALVALFTDTGNLTFADELVEQLAVLRRRHLVMTVTTEDPLLERERSLYPRVEKDVHRKTVAQRISDDRSERLRNLKRRGVVTLDVPPGQLAPSVIHQYIEIKNRALL